MTCARCESGPTFWEAMERYRASWSHSRGDFGVAVLNRWHQELAARFGAQTIACTTREQMDELLTSLLEKGFSTRTAAGYVEILRYMSARADRERWAPFDPLAGWAPPPPKLNTNTLSLEQLGSLIAAADPRMRAFLCLLLDGLKRHEIIALSWSQVNMESATLAVASRRAPAPLSDRTMETLRTLRASSSGDRVMSVDPRHVSRLFDRAKLRAKLANVNGQPVHVSTVHRTVALHLRRLGTPAEVHAAILGVSVVKGKREPSAAEVVAGHAKLNGMRTIP